MMPAAREATGKKWHGQNSWDNSFMIYFSQMISTHKHLHTHTLTLIHTHTYSPELGRCLRSANQQQSESAFRRTCHGSWPDPNPGQHPEAAATAAAANGKYCETFKKKSYGLIGN